MRAGSLHNLGLVALHQSAVLACVLGMAWRWVASAMLDLQIICYEGGDMQATVPNLCNTATSEQCTKWVTSDQRTGLRYPGSQKPTASYLEGHRIGVRLISRVCTSELDCPILCGGIQILCLLPMKL